MNTYTFPETSFRNITQVSIRCFSKSNCQFNTHFGTLTYMRSTEDRDYKLRPWHGKQLELPSTYIDPEEWIQGYVDNLNYFETITKESPEEDEILGSIPQPRTSPATKRWGEKGKLPFQKHQFLHLFRQMNYLRYLAAKTGNKTAQERAWKIRQDYIAGSFDYVVQKTLREVFPEYENLDHDDQGLLYARAIERLYWDIDHFNWTLGTNPFSWFSARLFVYLNKNVAPYFRPGLGPNITNVNAKSTNLYEAPEFQDSLDIDLAREFLDLLFEKAEQHRQSKSMRQTHPTTIRQIFEPFIVDGLGVREIAAETGITFQRVHQRIENGLMHMRQTLLEDTHLRELASQLDMGVDDEEDAELLIYRVAEGLRSHGRAR